MAFSPKEIKEAFALFDESGNGKISTKELGKVMQSMGMTCSDDEIKKMLKNADKDNDGELSIEEFTKIVNCSEDDDKELSAAFKEFDKDGSGYITKKELKEAMKQMGANVPDKELDEMIAAADTDKDGRVGLCEFKKMMSPS